MQHAVPNKLNASQLNLIKSFQFLHNEKQLKEMDSLINFYLEKKLDDAIEKAEFQNGYSASVYEQWLTTQNDKSKQ